MACVVSEDRALCARLEPSQEGQPVREVLVIRAEGVRRLAVIGDHPVYLFGLVVPLGFTVPQAVSAAGWWIVGLGCQLAVIVASIVLGATRSQIRLTDDEVIDRRIVGRKRWSWTEVGCLSIGQLGRGSVHLVVCVRHDPWPHRLRGFPMKSAYRATVADLVAEIRSHGYPVETPDADAHQWWSLDPRAQRSG